MKTFNSQGIYKQDYELLLGYFNKIYPVKDAFDGTLEPVFDVCFCNWIGKRDCSRIFLHGSKGRLSIQLLLQLRGICEYAFVLSLGALGTEGRIGIYSREQ